MSEVHEDTLTPTSTQREESRKRPQETSEARDSIGVLQKLIGNT